MLRHPVESGYYLEGFYNSIVLYLYRNLFAFSRRICGNPALRERVERLPGGRVIVRVYRALKVYRAAPRVVARSVGISVVAHTLAVLYFCFLSRALGITGHSPASYFFVVPVGLTVSSFGLPLGLGIGQAAFMKLFIWMGGSRTEGANLATLYQALLLAVNLLGLVPYLARHREVRQAEAQAEAEEGAPDA